MRAWGHHGEQVGRDRSSGSSGVGRAVAHGEPPSDAPVNPLGGAGT